MNELIALKLCDFYLTHLREPTQEELNQIAEEVAQALGMTKREKHGQTKGEF